MKREKHKHAFEIKAWADGWGILQLNHKDAWKKVKNPHFYTDCEYVVNDAYVEFRKSERQGETIQIKLITGNWSDDDISRLPPSEKMKFEFRIKPKTYKVELSKEDIVNLEHALNLLDYFERKPEAKKIIEKLNKLK